MASTDYIVTSSFALFSCSLDQQVSEDFDRARRRALLHWLVRRITRRHGELLAFSTVRKSLRMSSQHDLGVRDVPLTQIIGSMGRSHQFDRDFLPRDERTRDRWISIDRAHYQGIGLPPVNLYKVGKAYFVEDGNHRISVAKTHDQESIEAHVIEYEGHVKPKS